MMKLRDLTQDSRNANKGTARGQKMIVSSLQEDGFGRSGLLDKNGKIIAGNKTTEASAEVFGVDAEPIIIETDGTKPVYVKRTDLDLDTDIAARRLAYRDNLTSRFSFELDPDVVMADIEAGFDFEALDISLPDLQGLGVDVNANGAGRDVEPQIDKADELRQKWGTELGQLWQLGEHRLICGDCTDKEVIDKVMQGEKGKLFATDPPYGANAGTVGFTSQRDKLEAITSDDLQDWDMKEWLESCFIKWVDFLVDNAAWYLWHPMLTQGYFAAAAAAAAGIIIHRQIIWQKEQFIFGRGDYHWQHELCFYGWRQGHRPPFLGDRNQSTIWIIPWTEKRSELGHPTAKPCELWHKPINNHTKYRDVCVEPFCGSGSQLIACEQLNRRCRAVEIDPGYVAVTLQRWADHTGKMPELIEQ